MGIFSAFVVYVAVIFFIAHNSEVQDTFVLMPDPDGQVGQVEVITEGGSQVLSSAGESTTVTSSGKAPSAVQVMDEKTLAETFSAALDAEPLPPEKFILYFNPNSIELTPASQALLSSILTSIEQRESVDIAINGHSDRVGSEEYNLTLSLQRAERVKQFLQEWDISPDYLHVASHGEGNPLYDTPDDVAEPRNRRVEVIVR